jgi:malonyl CoA-acyl carrier protein transacylase
MKKLLAITIFLAMLCGAIHTGTGNIGVSPAAASFITEFSDAYPHAALMAVVNKGGELEKSKIESLTKEAQVYVALNNTKNQLVVGGFKKNLEELSKTLKKENLLCKIMNMVYL